MAVQDEDTGFLLRCTDDAVSVVQSLVTLVSSYYESGLGPERREANVMFGALNRESLEDIHRRLNELLAKLWPCEKRFVAVIGPTGSGKSTLLNLLTSVTCKTGEEYRKGIKLDESRAVLRDTVVEHGMGLKKDPDHVDGDRMEGDEDSQEDLCSGLQPEELASLDTIDLQAEKRAMCGLLGVCCNQDRYAYLSKHLPFYDRYPFLLQNARMGDAGTTKVTAVQWGPKFAARIQWVDKGKLRKRWRELRSYYDQPQPSEPSDKDIPLDLSVLKLRESKELWQSVLKIMDHPLDSGYNTHTPTEELIESTLKQLGKKVPLGKKEVIEMSLTQGCVVDRLFVREGIRKRLCEQKLGLLLEDLVIEAPIPYSEGGVSLLDVPGTNDPRVLHQRETRDAIDRTTLILLIVDKSVVDIGTQRVLEDSPVLERMLLDSSESCNLVVVGIAEKRGKSGQPASEIVAEFDPKQDLRKALRSVFLTKIRNLLSSRRLTKDEAKRRLDSIFRDNRFCVLPVLPLLCASLHLSASNPVLHQETCESPGSSTCPLVMSAEERMKMCLQTNIPKLLEMIQSVRVPLTREKLRSYLVAALAMLKMYTQECKYDQSMIEFFDRERKHGQRMSQEPIAVETLYPDNAVDMNYIKEKLSSYSQECILSPEDLRYIRLKIEDPASLTAPLTTINLDLPPVLIRGFRPEVIGNIARELIRSTEHKASVFVNAVYERMVRRMNGNVAWRDNHIDQVSIECLGSCVALLQDAQTQWKNTLERTLARCTCGGPDGGLQKHVRGALRTAYDTTFEAAIVDLRKLRSRKATTNERLTLLENFEFGEKVKDAAFVDIEQHLHRFWELLRQRITKTVSKLWSDWIRQLLILKESTKLDVEANTVSNGVHNIPDRNFRDSLRNKMSLLEQLVQRLESKELFLGDGEVMYGYSLLESNPFYETELPSVDSRQKLRILIEDSCQHEAPGLASPDADHSTPASSSAHSSPRGSLMGRQTPQSLPSPVGLSPTTPRSNSLPSPTPKLGGPMRLQQRRGVVALPETEAHNLHMANHTLRKDKKRKK